MTGNYFPGCFPTFQHSTQPHKNPLNALSRWKIVRQSAAQPGSYLVGAVVPVRLDGFFRCRNRGNTCDGRCSRQSISLPCAGGDSNLRPGQYWKQQFRDTLTTVGRTLLQCLLALVQLPFRAYYTTDAVLRTLYRLYISRRKLLEWETADAAERRLRHRSASLLVATSWIPLACVVVGAMLPPESRTAALPALALWFTSPAVAYYLGRPRVEATDPLSAEDRRSLRRIARRTWSFFEEFVGAEDNWLPPDNYQEFPRPKIAHRISPTNEGLFVLSAIAARDFGYVGVDQLARTLQRNLDHWTRLDRVFRTLLQLVRHDDTRAAATSIRFHRRQRQPRRMLSYGAPGDRGHLGGAFVRPIRCRRRDG